MLVYNGTTLATNPPPAAGLTGNFVLPVTAFFQLCTLLDSTPTRHCLHHDKL